MPSMGLHRKEGLPLLKCADSAESGLGESPAKAEDWSRTYLFLFLVFIRLVVHFDSGAISSGLGSGSTSGDNLGYDADQDILTDLNLSYAEGGLMVCLVYLGLSVACTFGGFLLERYPSKWVLTATFIIDLLCIITFALSTDKYTSLASRFVVGVAQAFLIMYLPVWVDEYAPEGSSTSWLAMSQIGSNLGIILGYIVSGLVAAHTQYSWRVPFWLQVALLVPAIMLFASLQPQSLEISTRRPPDNGRGPHAEAGSPFLAAIAEFPAVLSQPVFVYATGALSVLYFVVAGMQVWISPFLSQPPFSERPETVVFIYSTIASSAPALGLVVGGLALDQQGGYKDPRHTVDLACVFCLVAVAAAWLTLWTSSLPLAAVLVWVLLFCGGFVVPACVGLGLQAVDRPLRPTASSLSLLLCNLCGWFAGPVVSGTVATLAGDVRWGMRTTLAWSSLGVVFLALLRCTVARQVPEEPCSEPSPATA